MVVSYDGDASKAGQFPHGNDHTTSRNYVRTQPHVLRLAQAAGGESVKSTYNSLVASSGPLQPSSSTSAPRNTMQISNAKKYTRNASRLSRDALYNLTEFAHDAKFVRHITLFPDLEVIMTHESAIDTFKSLLSSQPATGRKLCTTLHELVLYFYCKLWTQAIASMSTSKFSQFFYTTNRLPVPL